MYATPPAPGFTPPPGIAAPRTGPADTALPAKGDEAFWAYCLRLLGTPGVTELHVQYPGRVLVEQHGRYQQITVGGLANSPDLFRSEFDTFAAQHTIPVKRPANESRNLYEGELRLNLNDPVHAIRGRLTATLPPTAEHPQVTMTRANPAITSLSDLAHRGAMSADIYQFLIDAVEVGLTMGIAGENGTGKTTLMEALSHYLPDLVPIFLVEEIRELVIPKPFVKSHLVITHTPGMNDADDAVDASWIVRQAVRSRALRVFFGEVRGGEAWHLLKALNAGSSGSMFTFHASSIEMAYQKILQYAAEDVSATLSRADLVISTGTGVDLLVLLRTRLINGVKHRWIGEIAAVSANISGDQATPAFTPLWRADPLGQTFTRLNAFPQTLADAFEAAGRPVAARPYLHASTLGQPMPGLTPADLTGPSVQPLTTV